MKTVRTKILKQDAKQDFVLILCYTREGVMQFYHGNLFGRLRTKLVSLISSHLDERMTRVPVSASAVFRVNGLSFGHTKCEEQSARKKALIRELLELDGIQLEERIENDN